jgi:ABC-type glycerol-3-phosphate transport system substrate-binding protein
MKKILTWVCILALITTLAGCSKGNNNKHEANSFDTSNEINNPVPITGVGSYVEHEMKQPEMQQGERSFGYRLNSSNQYEIYTYVKEIDKTCNKVYCYTLDGDSYQKSSLEWAENACKELNAIPRHFGYSEDGNVYIIFIKNTTIDGKNIQSIILLTNEGTNGYRDISLPSWKDGTNMMPNFSGSYIDTVRVTKDQIMCFRDLSRNELQFYDLKNEKMVDYDVRLDASAGDVILRNNIIYFSSDDETSLKIFDMDQGTLKTIPLPSSPTFFLSKHIEVGPENEILFIDEKGIKILKDETGTWETIVDGSQNTMSTPSYSALSLVAMPGAVTTYYVVYSSDYEGMNDLVVKYEPNKDGTITYEKELTICSLYENASIREAISYYRRKHPEVKITYNVLMEGSHSLTETDVIQTLNTELLAGKGADIIIMDGLPLYDYIEKGVFMDISDLFTKDAGESILLQNIADCYTRSGEIFCMPMRVILPYYAMHEDILSSTKTVEALAAYCDGKELKLMEPYRYDKLARFFLINYSNEIFTEDDQIDREGLSSFLRSIDIIAKQIGSDANANGGYLEEDDLNARLMDLYLGYPDTLMWENHTMLCMDTILSNYDYLHLIAILNQTNGTFGPINGTFYPNGLVGINQKTKESELAKDFVSSLFAETMQSLDPWDGFPVNESALSNWIKPDSTRSVDTYWTQNFVLEEIPFQGFTEDNIRNVVTMVKSLTRPAYTDDSGITMIVEGAVSYLKGEITLDQAVDEISQKVNLYQIE